MEIIPAVDIIDKKCVRLRQGNYKSVNFYNDDPVESAVKFLKLGAKRIHIVDLDAAKNGNSENYEVIKNIIINAKKYNAKVQVGGGIRSIGDIEKFLKIDADFIIIGTAAIKNQKFLKQVNFEFPEKILMSGDFNKNMISISGWVEKTKFDMENFFSMINDSPPSGVIFTDIIKDGMMSGINEKLTHIVANRSPCPVIVAGGVRDKNDVRVLKNISDNISGVIVGRAIHENSQILTSLLED